MKRSAIKKINKHIYIYIYICICFININARLFCDACPRLHVIRNDVEKVINILDDMGVSKL